MTNDEKIEFYARAYNTMQEIARTAQNNDIRLRQTNFACSEIDEKVIKWDFTQEQKDRYIDLTDRLEDRIYFNL